MSESTRSIDSSSLLVRDAHGEYSLATSEEVLNAARRAMSHRVRRGATLSSPEAVRYFLQMKLGTLEHEVFATLLLDSQHRVIDYVELFRGTLAQTSVYPRVALKAKGALPLFLQWAHGSVCAATYARAT